MLWFFLSLATAIFLSTNDALSKTALEGYSEELIAWVRWGLAAPFLLLILPFIDIPEIDHSFWIIVIIAIPLEMTAIILYMKAIKVSPLSLTIPFLALTPLFLIFTSFILLGEMPDASGICGILLIVTGAYVLNIGKKGEGILAPLRAVTKERGSLLMIVVAFIYSITASLGKMAILHSSPLFFAVTYTFLLSACLFPFAWIKRKRNFLPPTGRPILFVMIGLTYALMLVCHFTAVSMIEVTYMISIKRTSLIFSVIYGWLIFRETNIRERLMGSVVMVSGVAMIVI